MRYVNLDKTVRLSAGIVSTYISRNPISASALPVLIDSVHATLQSLTGAEAISLNVEAPRPAVPIRKSISDDYLTCLEDGRRFKSLKRHLRVRYNMTPEQYRLRWKLPLDYPMVAPGYAKTRSRMAKSMGLGQRRSSEGGN